MTAPVRPRYGTRWKRALCVLVPAVGLTVGAATFTAQDVMASAVVFQDKPSSIATGGLIGDKAGIGVVQTKRSVGGDVTTSDVIRVSLASMRIDGLCISQQQDIAGLTYTVRVTAGDGKAGTYETTGSNATLDMTEIRGDGDPGINLDGLVELGVSAESLTTTESSGKPDPNPLDAPSGTGWFGIDADVGSFSDVRGTTHGLRLESLAKIPGFTLSVEPGDKPCSSDPIPH
ncbi:DUF6230 family protein [Demetria terragena]|uniref:DUF6230 family protein n=1 Tax=Demetria terragena TaxID=63959 RepID=UPI00036FCC9E|nr:DUF6230 family protein [Demetria terragena]